MNPPRPDSPCAESPRTTPASEASPQTPMEMASDGEGTPKKDLSDATGGATDAVALATKTIKQMCGHLRCSACESTLVSKSRPWRSQNCEHVFCASCAAIARGESTARQTRKDCRVKPECCPVSTCQVPLRPADVVPDLSVWHIVLACAALDEWADNAQTKPE